MTKFYQHRNQLKKQGLLGGHIYIQRVLGYRNRDSNRETGEKQRKCLHETKEITSKADQLVMELQLYTWWVNF